MSIGSIIGGIVGGIIGFFVGGPLGAVYGAAIGFGIGTIVDPITPDIPPPGKPQVGKLTITTADEGIAIADVLGTTKMVGNILWYGNNRSRYVEQEQPEGKGGFFSSMVDTLDPTGENAPGYHYYLTFAIGLSIGPVDTLYTVYKSDECVWEGELHIPESGGEETITLVDHGTMTFYFGTTDQVAPAAMTSLLEDPTLSPNYRRLCYAFFNDKYLGQYNRCPVYKFVFKKSPVLSFNSDNEMETYFYNPAHAIYYILSEMIGLDEQYLNIFTFNESATKLFLEDRGVNITLDRQAPALRYLETILSHIDGVLRWGIDGRLHLKLMRSDERIEDMLVMTEDLMLDDLSFQRKSWLDTQNEVKVQYPLLVVGDCELCLVNDVDAPILALISQNGSVGSFEITDGCPPFYLYYRLSSSSFGPWVYSRTITGRKFNGLASHAGCGFEDIDREMKVVDYYIRDSNSLDIKITSITPLIWDGNKTVNNTDGSVVISWTGGGPPFRLQTSNPLLTFDTQFYSQFLETGLQSATLYFTNQLCGLEGISIRDACDQGVNGRINVLANLAYDGGSSDLTIGKDDTAVQVWTDGIGPFSVQLTGAFEDIWLDEAMTITTNPFVAGHGITLYSGPTGCGDATVEVTDTCGITVQAVVVGGDCCDEVDDLSFDDASTPNTINPGGNINIYVKDGIGPYDWSITDGWGHVLGSASTSGVSNTLTSGTGTCGNHYSPSVEITVEDSCGDFAVFEIRNTGGGWVRTGSPRHASTTCGSSSLCNPTCYRSYIVGKDKWIASPITRGGSGSCACTRISGNWTGWGSGSSKMPPISPYTMWTILHEDDPLGCGGNCGNCAFSYSGLDLYRCYYDEWTC